MQDLIILSDATSLDLKQVLISHIKTKQIQYLNLEIAKDSVMDSVDLAKQLQAAIEGTDKLGIFLSSNGQMANLVCNRYREIRAAYCRNSSEAKLARTSMNANVLCLDQTALNAKETIDILNGFLVNKPNLDLDKINKLNALVTEHASLGVNLIARAIILHLNHILVAIPAKDNSAFSNKFHYLPGGHVDYQESSQDALKRELLEEMNFVAESLSFVGVLECTWPKKNTVYHEINMVYLANANNLSLDHPPKSTEAHINFVWLPLEKLIEDSMLPRQQVPMIFAALQQTSNALLYTDMI